MKDDTKKEDDLLDTLDLDNEESEKLIELVESGADEDEALDLIGDNTVDPTTEDPYESEEPIV